MKIFDKSDLLLCAAKVYEKRGKEAVQEVASRFVLTGARVSLSNIPENKIDDVVLALQACLGNRVMGYAYGSSVPVAAPRPITINGAKIVVREPGKKNRVVSGFDELPKREHEFNVTGRVVKDRESAQALVQELREKFDLLDDEATMRLLLDRMEERHGEEFNHFFEATIRQIMMSSGMSELRISTSAVLHTLASEPTPLVVREVPGFLVYTLVEDVPDADIH